MVYPIDSGWVVVSRNETLAEVDESTWGAVGRRERAARNTEANPQSAIDSERVAAGSAQPRNNLHLTLPAESARALRINSELMDAIQSRILPEAFDAARREAYQSVKDRLVSDCDNVDMKAFPMAQELLKNLAHNSHELTPQDFKAAFKTAYEVCCMTNAVRKAAAAFLQNKNSLKQAGLDEQIDWEKAVNVFTLCKNSQNFIKKCAEVQNPEGKEALINQLIQGDFQKELKALQQVMTKSAELAASAKQQFLTAGLTEAQAQSLVQSLGNGRLAEAERRNPQTGCLEGVEELTQQMAEAYQKKANRCLQTLAGIDALNLPEGSGKDSLKELVARKALKNPDVVKAVDEVAKSINFQELAAVLSKKPLEQQELTAVLSRFCETAVKSLNAQTALLEQTQKASSIELKDQDHMIDLAGSVMTIFFARHPQLAELCNQQSDKICEAVQKGFQTFKRTSNGTRNFFLLAFSQCQQIARVAERQASYEIADHLQHDDAGNAAMQFSETMHRLFGKRADADLTHSKVWQKVKADLIERHEAGENLTQAMRDKACEQAVMKQVVESMADEVAAGLGKKAGDFDLSGFLQSRAVQDLMSRVRSGKEAGAFASNLSRYVASEISMQQTMMNFRDECRDESIQELASWLGEPEEKVRSTFALDLHKHLTAMISQWLQTGGRDAENGFFTGAKDDDSGFFTGVKLEDLQPAAHDYCRQAFLLREAAGDRRNPGKISKLQADDATKQHLQALLPALLSTPAVKAQIDALENGGKAREMLDSLLQKEAANLQAYENRLQSMKERTVVKALADLSVVPAAVLAASGKVLDAAIAQACDKLFAAAERKDGVITQEALDHIEAEARQVAEQYVNSRRSALQEVNASKLPEELKQAVCEGMLADSTASGGALREKVQQTGLFDEAFLAAYPALSDRVKQGIQRFCRSGFNREALEAAVSEVAGKTLDTLARARVQTEIEVLPDKGPTAAQAAEVLKVMDFECNAAQIEAFAGNVRSSNLRKALGLEQMKAAGEALTVERRQNLEERLAALQEYEKTLKDEVESLKIQSEYQKLPADFWKEVSREMDQAVIRQANSGAKVEAGVAEFKAQVEKLRQAETNFGMMLVYLSERYSGWSDDQKFLLMDTLSFLHETVPGQKLHVYSGIVDALAAVLTGQHAKVALPAANSDVFLKTMALAGLTATEGRTNLVMGKLGKLTAEFSAKGDQLRAQDVFRVLFPFASAQMPAAGADLESLGKLAEKNFWRLMDKAISSTWPQYGSLKEEARQEAMKRWARYHTDKKGKVAKIPAETLEEDMFSNIKENSSEWEIMELYQLEAGLRLQDVVNHLQTPRGFTLDSFVQRPRITLTQAGSKTKAEGQFIGDFLRGGSQKEVGGMSFEIVQTDGRTTRVHNGSDGFVSPKDVEQFKHSQLCSKSRTVFKALQELCNGNEEQYRLALQTLSQGGIRSYASLLVGARKGAETQFAYRVTKDDDGNLIISARTSDPKDSNLVEATVTIRPDGTAEYTDFLIQDRSNQGGAPERQ